MSDYPAWVHTAGQILHDKGVTKEEIEGWLASRPKPPAHQPNAQTALQAAATLLHGDVQNSGLVLPLAYRYKVWLDKGGPEIRGGE